MALPSSPVQIACMALDQFGEAPINSIDAPTTTAESIVARHYDATRQELLREYVWNFAKKRARCLRAPAATPDFDFSDAYAAPNDNVRFLSIKGETESTKTMDYDYAGGFILMNNGSASSIRVRYIADITDVNKWEPLFRDLFILKLAMKICYAFTKSEAIVKRINELYTLAIPSAISIDGQERPPERIEESRILKSRTGSHIGYAGKWTVFED